MLKNLLRINTSWWEFLIKFPLVLFVIMPGCMGGSFWIGVQLDATAHINFLKFIFPFIGTLVGVYITSLLIMVGHTKPKVDAQAEAAKPYSDALVSKPYEYTDISSSPKVSIPRAGYATPFILGGKTFK